MTHPETLRELRERLDGYHERYLCRTRGTNQSGQFEYQVGKEWPRISKALEEIDALLDERDRLKAAMATAGLECFMSDATPQQVADHMRAVSASWEGQRARNERLVEGNRQAFVMGARWWEFHVSGATMWQSDQKLAQEEFDRRVAAAKEGT